jgi:biotin transporter BioY
MALKKKNKIWVFILILLAILLVFYVIGAFVFNGIKG